MTRLTFLALLMLSPFAFSQQSNERRDRLRLEAAREEIRRDRLAIQRARAEERLSQMRTAESLSQSKENWGKDIGLPLGVALVGSSAIVIGALITANKTSKSLLDSINIRGDLDRTFEADRNATQKNLEDARIALQRDIEDKRIAEQRIIEQNRLDASGTIEEMRINAEKKLEGEKASNLKEDESRRLEIAECDRRIEAIAKLIVELRLFIRDASEANSYSVYAREAIVARQGGEAYKDWSKETFDAMLVNYATKKATLVEKIDISQSSVVIEAERYGWTPQEVAGKPYPLGAFIAHWAKVTANYVSLDFATPATFTGQIKEISRELWALSEIENNKKDALMSGEPPKSVSIKWRWLSSAYFESAYDDEVLDDNLRVLKESANRRANSIP